MKRRLYKQTCIRCKKEFHPFNRKQILCSNSCSALYKTEHTRYKKTCKHCKKKFTTRKRRNQIFCSKKCFLLEHSKDTKTIPCIVCKKKFIITGVDIKRGRKFCSNKCMGIYYSKTKKGKNNPAYIDGKNKERNLKRDQDRATIEYKNFVRAVFIRGNNTCQMCGAKRKRKKNGIGKNNNLTVHHIKHWKTHPKLRYEISNGIVLCIKCHYKIHNKRYKESK